ncbi:MAG: GDSL-type esterase/lipase family protein, partial [Patescibacteria group bacterium]
MDKTYCIFRDSVTQAGYVKTGWVEMLRQYLEEKYPDNFVSVFNLGINGETTDNVLTRFDNECLVRRPTDIIFAVGINDTKDYDAKQFKDNIEKLISLGNKFTKDITFVGLVLGDWQGEEP